MKYPHRNTSLSVRMYPNKKTLCTTWVLVGLVRTPALASRGRHRRLCSVTDHQCIHQFLVKPIGDLLAAVEEDLLHLLLPYGGSGSGRRARRLFGSQRFETALHLDHVCVHRRAPLFVAHPRPRLFVELLLPMRVQNSSTPDAFFTTALCVKGRRKTCRRRRVVGTSCAVVTFLATDAAAVARNGWGRDFHR